MPVMHRRSKEVQLYSKTPDLIAFRTSNKVEILNPNQLATLKAGTLQVLEEVGVRFPSRKALEIFADHGAYVDWDTEIVRIPPELVEKSLATAPRSFILGGREKRFDLVLDGDHSYLATDGCGVRVVDFETRELRASMKEDVVRMARVCDALPLINFFWPLVSAQDHGLTAPLHECHAGLTNTLKHVRGGTTVPPELAPFIVEMATVVAGSDENLRNRPPICANICTIAPLAHDGDGIETAMIYAQAGIPTSFMAMPTMGSTAPATPLGALITGDAEVVSAMVLIQLVSPGAPVFHSNYISLMHPRTGGYIGGINKPLGMIAVQMAHAWNVPSLGGGSVTSDAGEIGWRSGSKAGLGAVFIALAGGEICGYLGMLEGSMLLYPEQVILDHEICQNAYDLLSEFEFNEAAMALDVIKAVGPGSHFLRQDHTRKHLRDFQLSRILNPGFPDDLSLSSREAALEEFKRIDGSHQPEPLSKPVLEELDRILTAADREAERLQ
jgi:trimethylamine--corrinoid protein Co-methyltransferase